MGKRATTLFVLAATVSWCALLAPARADVIYLKGGFQVEGKVVRMERRRVFLRTLTGLKIIPRSRIARIRRKPWLPGELLDRLDRVRRLGGRKRVRALVDWALDPSRKKKLEPLLPRVFKLVLKWDPDNEKARKAMGFVRYKGKWMTPKERDALKEKEEVARAEKRLQEEEEERKRNFAYGGAPLDEQIAAEAASDRADAWALAGALGVPAVTVLSSRRISIQGFLSPGEARALLDLGERALSTWGREIYEDPCLNPFAARRGKFHFYLVRARDLPALEAYVSKTHGGVNASDRRFFRAWGLGIPPNGWDHYCLTLLELHPFHLEAPFLRALARSWIEASADARLMPWFPEGFAVEAVRRILGTSQPVRVEFSLRGRPYAYTDGVTWRRLILTLGRIRKDPPLSQVFLQSEKTLTVYDTAKAAGITAMLWEKDPRDIGLLARYLGYKHGTQPWAVKRLFGRGPEGVDELFRLWAARREGR